MHVLLACLLLSSFADNGVAGTHHSAEQDSTAHKAFSWSVIPIIFSTPDTDWAFGALPQAVVRLPGAQRPSRFYVAAYYTLNRQYAVTTAGSFWLNADRDNLSFKIDTKYWPTDFYGLSAASTDVEGVEYTERILQVSTSASRDMGSGIRLGLVGRLGRMRLETDDEDTGLNLGGVQGEQGGWVVSLGPSVGFDSRDHVFYPTSGWQVDVSSTLSGYGLGGDYDFLTIKADARTYLRLSNTSVLAAQGVVELHSADVPFWDMSGIGSSVRGYSSMRFLDRQYAAFQLEYRLVPILWRIGLTAFVGAGAVSSRIDELPTSRFRYAAGLGFRFLFMKEAKINIRWDFAFGPGSSGDYLEMAEAY